MKKKSLILLLCLFIIVGIVFAYSRVYTLTDNKTQLKDNILQFSNRPSAIYNNIDIKEELNLDNKKYILYIIDNTLGNAELTKGLNNKYKIETTGSGSSYFFIPEIYKTNKGKYLILKGKNPDMKIVYAKVLVDNKEYRINIPKKTYFLVYCAVPIKTQIVYPDANNLKLYNKNDVDITNEMMKILN
ncbi:hypothetical protein [Clostridium estertheticum]|uniref:hypothetical protein n=1 Tax=Clostridium estertheticum TaxID=238834 RepID=UPI001CF25C91|nr:hypothetical protein [Clostridium estertheticum]MCB2356917.1 hypothetical protein [Clostridium estertheticum]WAG44003.1 hypothetical protein LL065_26045 [Clostridium estertheticum]